MDQPVTDMYETWISTARTAALVLIVSSSTFYILYIMIIGMIKNRSSRYKFVQDRETTVMWVAGIGFAIAVGLIINSFMLNERDFTHLFVFALKTGLPVAIAITFGFAIRAYLNVYYPFILEKRLADIRFRERKHPKTKRPMRLLNEEEEDKYLTEEMIRQEEEFRYDFDVWLDEQSGQTIIETYKGSTNRICGKCYFRTLKLVNEELDEETNTKVLHFACSHCGHKEHEHDI